MALESIAHGFYGLAVQSERIETIWHVKQEAKKKRRKAGASNVHQREWSGRRNGRNPGGRKA